MILAREVDSYVKRKATYRQNKESIYAIILGECTEVMRAKLKSLHSFSTEASPKSDGIKLLKLIRQISYEFESQRYPFLSVHNAVQQSYSMFQKLHQTIDEYYENVSIKLDMLDHCGASISGHLTLTNGILKNKNITHPLPTDLSNANSKQKKDITP